MKKICYFFVIRLDNKVINFFPLNDEGYDKLTIQLKSEYLTDSDKSKNNRKWLIDIDKKDLILFTKIREKLPEEFFEEVFETKNGYHLIYKRKFNISEYLKRIDCFDEEMQQYIVEYKSNAKTLVYMEYSLETNDFIGEEK